LQINTDATWKYFAESLITSHCGFIQSEEHSYALFSLLWGRFGIHCQVVSSIYILILTNKIHY